MTLKLKITYETGETRQITNDLNYTQFRALVEHAEKGRLGNYKEIKITRK